MEKYQILRPRRARGTPFTSFVFKSFLVAVTIGLGITYHYQYRHGPDFDFKRRAGFYEEPDKIKKKRLFMSMALVFSMQPAEKVAEMVQEAAEDVSLFTEYPATLIPEEDL